MAYTKNTTIRERVIDRCLSDREKKYTTQDIMEACSKALVEEGYGPVTSMNTTRADMRDINRRWSAFGGKIVEERVGRNIYYYYEDESFSIYRSGLNEEDVDKLNQAMEVLARYEGLERFGWVGELNARIQTALLAHPETQAVISFEADAWPMGRQFLTPVFEAINAKQDLAVRFQPEEGGEPVARTVHPYFLKEFNHRWFLLAQEVEGGNRVALPLDQFIEVSSSSHPYAECPDGNLAVCQGDAVGVNLCLDQPVETVKLWVSASLYPRLAAHPLHPSQTLCEAWNDGNKVVQLQVKIDEDLIQRLLSYGEKVAVMAPESLHHAVQQRIWWMGESYARF